LGSSRAQFRRNSKLQREKRTVREEWAMQQKQQDQLQTEESKRTTSSKPIPHVPLPFKEVIADVLKVKPLEKEPKAQSRKKAK
jgi:hypothetical protein